MIRFSALLVAVAIALLVSGVIASSLPLVYVSIGGCAIAALLLAVGVYRHRQEIFGAQGAVVRVSPPEAVPAARQTLLASGSVAVGHGAGSAAGSRATGRAAGLAPGPARESVGPDTAQRPVRESAREPAAPDRAQRPAREPAPGRPRASSPGCSPTTGSRASSRPAGEQAAREHAAREPAARGTAGGGPRPASPRMVRLPRRPGHEAPGGRTRNPGTGPTTTSGSA